MRQRDALNLGGVQSDSIDLELIIDPAVDLQQPVGAETSQVTSPVEQV